MPSATDRALERAHVAVVLEGDHLNAAPRARAMDDRRKSVLGHDAAGARSGHSLAPSNGEPEAARPGERGSGGTGRSGGQHARQRTRPYGT